MVLTAMIRGAIPSNHIDAPLYERTRTGPTTESPPEGRVKSTPRRYAMRGENVPQDDEREEIDTARHTMRVGGLAQTPTSNVNMPSTSPEQKRTMAAIAHGWKPDNPRIARIPVKVAKEFNKADAGKSKVARAHRRGLISDKAQTKVREQVAAR